MAFGLQNSRALRLVDPWSAHSVLIALLVTLPLLTVVGGIFITGEEWQHIAETVLWKYVWNTLLMVVLVGALAMVLAVPAAWLVSAFEFPGRKIFSWSLMLPLAIPTYVAAFVYYQIPENAIPLLVSIRSHFGVDAFRMAEVLLRYSLLAILMAAVLYPYIYISAKATFERQRRAMIEAAQTLKRKPTAVFFTVALPLARPAVIAGMTLVIMEVINDYGAVHFFGVTTVTEGIFRTWFGLGDRSSALRLAGLVMIAVLAFIMIEGKSRGRARFSEQALDATPLSRRQMGPGGSLLAILVCLIPLSLGFLYPFFRLLSWALPVFGDVFETDFLVQMKNSILLAFGTAVVLTILAMVLSYTTRLHASRRLRMVNRVATIGYAAPGAVIAVGVMVATGYWDALLVTMGWSNILVSGSIGVICCAYIVRFMAVAYHPIQAGMIRTCGSLDEASRVLGNPPLRTLLAVNFPLLRGTLVAAMMLVFVDILKELPLTMILRPANFETLATTAFGLAKEGRIQECAVPSLIIIFAGAVGLLLLNVVMLRKDQR